MNRIERTFYLGVIALLLVTLLVKTCNGHHNPCNNQLVVQTNTQKTIFKSDSTVWYQPKKDTKIVPEKQDGKSKFLEKSLPRVDSSEAYAPKPVQNLHFIDVSVLRDSVRIAGGYVIIDDSISQNEVQRRKVYTNFPQTVITTTVAPKQIVHSQVFIGARALVEPQQPGTLAVGPTLSLLTRQERIYSIGVLFTSRGTKLYEAGVSFPIHIHFGAQDLVKQLYKP